MFNSLRYEQQIIDYLTQVTNNLKLQPIYLGSTSSGTGTPPGGYTGYLPQSKVSYDINEQVLITTSGTPSIIDNLNHIRYNIAVLSGVVETGGQEHGIIIKNNGSVIASGIKTIDFIGNLLVEIVTADEVTVTSQPINIYNQALFTIAGTGMKSTDIGVKPFRIYPNISGYISEIICSLHTPPTSTAVRINILLNSGTIFDTEEYIEIPVGYNYIAKTADFLITSIDPTDYLQIAVVQGDTDASDLVAHIRYYYQV